MKPSLRIIGLLAPVFLSSFGAGAITAAFSHRASPAVTVRIHNNAVQPIASLHLRDQHGMILITSVAPGETCPISFYAPGGSRYQLDLTFADGRVLTGGTRYVGVGKEVTQVITDAGISSPAQVLSYVP